MNNSNKLIIEFLAMLIVGLLIVLGISYRNEFSTKLSLNATKEQQEDWIKEKVKRHIRNGLSKGEKYISLSWPGGSYTDNLGSTTGYDMEFHIPSSEWSKLSLSHIFKITNKEGCESHYHKHFEFDREGNIIEYRNYITGDNILEFITGQNEGPLRNADNKELIIWGEDIIRKYIHSKIDIAQKYVPVKWNLYTKLTLDREKFDALDITFTSDKSANKFHSDWIYAALCIEHTYKLEGPGDTEIIKHNMFIINPQGQVKECPYSYFTQKKSGKDIYNLLFKNF